MLLVPNVLIPASFILQNLLDVLVITRRPYYQSKKIEALKTLKHQSFPFLSAYQNDLLVELKCDGWGEPEPNFEVHSYL